MNRLTMFVLLGAFWVVLNEGDPGSWVIGIIFILIAVFSLPRTTRQNSHRASFSPASLPVFLGYFSIESLHGGYDVSRRVLATHPQVDPVFFCYRMRLKSLVARHLFVNCVSLLPGTLCADWGADIAKIHSLESSPAPSQSLDVLEQVIGRLFGEDI